MIERRPAGSSRGAGPLAALLAVAACHQPQPQVTAPPRADDRIVYPHQASLLSVPITADIGLLHQALEREVPRELWQINQHFPACVPAQKVKVFGAHIAVTPKLGCTIVGVVRRDAIRLRGEGEEIVADIPIHATISARDVGGIIKNETATGAAMAHARVHLTLDPQWNPHASARLTYDWTSPPGISLLGQRITFTDRADEKLQPIVRQLERELPREVTKLQLREQVNGAWRDGFTVLKLNDDDPPVWMRVTPQRLSYGGYAIDGNTLRLSLGLEAFTETFVGKRPEASRPTPLPPMGTVKSGGRLRLFVPVVADYAQLEPVILRALVKRAQRPFVLPKIGPVTARFDHVTAYGTQGGRIAVGIDVAAKPSNGKLAETTGRVWLTALPVNAPGSRTVEFRDLRVDGAIDRVGGNVLLALANAPETAQTIADALTQNFEGDFADLLGKIRRAVQANRQGDFVIHARVSGVDTGELRAAGQGLFLPVWANGSAQVAYAPHGAAAHAGR